MVVGDFDVEGVTIAPTKTNPKLFIDSNAELTRPIALQRLQTVTGRNSEIVQSAC